MTERSARLPRARKFLRLSIIPVVSALIVALTVIAVLLVRSNQRDAATDAARHDAPAAARETVARMLSYTATSVDKDLGAVPGLSGSFQKAYHDLVTRTIIQVAKDKGVSTRARVVSTGILSAAPDRVTLLMYIDQVTVSTAVPAPTTSSSRVSVTTEKRDGHWLVDDMTPM